MPRPILLPLLLGLLLVGCASSRESQVGYASWHGPSMFSRQSQTASGRKWWPWSMVAAHRTLPLGTVVLVTNLENDRKVKLTIIDRGPYIEGRIIDISKKAAKKLGMIDQGAVQVRVEVLKTP